MSTCEYMHPHQTVVKEPESGACAPRETQPEKYPVSFRLTL